VLSGNVRDLQAAEISPGIVTAQSLQQCLASTFRSFGYAHIFLYEPIVGFSCLGGVGESTGPSETALQQLGLVLANGRAAGGIDVLSSFIDNFVGSEAEPAALVIDLRPVALRPYLSIGLPLSEHVLP